MGSSEGFKGQGRVIDRLSDGTDVEEKERMGARTMQSMMNADGKMSEDVADWKNAYIE